MKLVTVKEAADIASQKTSREIASKTIYSWLVRGRKGNRLGFVKIGYAVMIPEHELDIFLSKTFQSINLLERKAA
jgi:hypothetical protein